MNGVLFVFGWLLVIFFGIPAVSSLFLVGFPGLILLIPAFAGVAMLSVRSSRRRKDKDDDDGTCSQTRCVKEWGHDGPHLNR